MLTTEGEISGEREIDGFPAYRVTSDGRVWTCWKRANTVGNGRGYVMGDVFKPRTGSRGNKYGHIRVGLNDDCGRQHQRWVHKLVLEAFCGPCPIGMQACHNDGDPTHNWIDNLRWDTPRNNQLDRRLHGTNLEGSKHPMAKLTEEQITEIRSLGIGLDVVISQKKLAEIFGVNQQTICNIVHGRFVESYKLSDEQIEEIRSIYRRGVIQKELAVRYGVSQAHISKILRGGAWTHVKEEEPDYVTADEVA